MILSRLIGRKRPAITTSTTPPTPIPAIDEQHTYATGPGSCFACSRVGVQMLVYTADGTVVEALCHWCIDVTLADDEAVRHLARVGSTWVLLPHPVSSPTCLEALATALYEHRLPFLAGAEGAVPA